MEINICYMDIGNIYMEATSRFLEDDLNECNVLEMLYLKRVLCSNDEEYCFICKYIKALFF